MSKTSLIAAVALLASAAGCLAPVDAHDDEATGAAREALVTQPGVSSAALDGPDVPTPLDGPLFVPPLRRHTGVLEHRFEPEPDEDGWEYDSRWLRCAVRYITIWEPRGTPLQVPVEACP